MGNIANPEEHMVIELHAIRQREWRRAWDGERLSSADREHITRIDNLIDFVAKRSARARLATAIDKGVETVSYLNKLARPCGYEIIDLEAERQKRKIADINDYRKSDSAG